MIPEIATLVLHWKSLDDTIECLNYLTKSNGVEQEIFVLLPEEDQVVEQNILLKYPEVTPVRIEKNLGFAGNNNCGLRQALKRNYSWFYLLNNDTIQSPDCLAKLIEIGNSAKENGIIGPMVYHYDEPEIIQSAGGDLNRLFQATHYGQNERDNGQFNSPREVKWLSGCSFLIKRQVLEQIGLINEDYFMYWEETDWCFRASEVGWKIIHVPGAHVWHKGVQRNYNPSPKVTYYYTRNQFLFMSQHHAPIKAWSATWFSVFRTLTSWTLLPKWRDKRLHRNAMWQGAMDFLQKKWGPQI
jgi:GT2 family glycosyltransferase